MLSKTLTAFPPKSGIVILSVLIITVAASSPLMAATGSLDANQLTDCFPAQPPERLDRQDYRKSTEKWRRTVENHHFDSHYAAFIAGLSRVPQGRRGGGEPPSAGFDYTLWGFPNHPKALAAIEKLGFETKTNKLPSMLLPTHCYFERGIKFYSDDPNPHAIYAYYLARRNNPEKALVHIKRADKLNNESADIYLYLAWSALEIENYELATRFARHLYKNGYPLPGLRNRLIREGIDIDNPTQKRETKADITQENGK